jgi:hypothetical protein
MFDELKSVPKSKDRSKPNPDLDKAIEVIRSKYPHMFLQDHELRDRRFYDEPEHPTIMASYLHPCPSRRVDKPRAKRDK